MSRLQSRSAIVVLIILPLATIVLAAQGVATQDRDKLVQYLTSTRDQVISEAATLSDEQWSFKPAQDRWSVGEVVEHLALAESFLFDLQQKTMAAPAAAPDQQAATQGKDEMLLKVIPDRTKKQTAPEPLQPGPSLGSRADVMAAFKERRAKTLEYASKTTDNLRAHVADSPLGPLDGYQWLVFVGAHTERHLGQIREVKADGQFPKSETK